MQIARHSQEGMAALTSKKRRDREVSDDDPQRLSYDDPQRLSYEEPQRLSYEEPQRRRAVVKRKKMEPWEWGAYREDSSTNSERFSWTEKEIALIGEYCSRHRKLYPQCKRVMCQMLEFLNESTEGANILRRYFHKHHTIRSGTFMFVILFLIDD